MHMVRSAENTPKHRHHAGWESVRPETPPGGVHRGGKGVC